MDEITTKALQAAVRSLTREQLERYAVANAISIITVMLMMDAPQELIQQCAGQGLHEAGLSEEECQLASDVSKLVQDKVMEISNRRN